MDTKLIGDSHVVQGSLLSLESMPSARAKCFIEQHAPSQWPLQEFWGNKKTDPWYHTRKCYNFLLILKWRYFQNRLEILPGMWFLVLNSFNCTQVPNWIFLATTSDWATLKLKVAADIISNTFRSVVFLKVIFVLKYIYTLLLCILPNIAKRRNYKCKIKLL